MNKPKTSNNYHPAGILFIGALLAQMLASIHVYLSNLNLHSTVSAVSGAGYLAIPNDQVMNNLKSIGSAFWGGLFFTFSTGAGLSLGSMAAAWAWTRFFQRSKIVLSLILFGWGGLLFYLNLQGFILIPTLYGLLIPPLIFTLTCRREARTNFLSSRLQHWFHLMPIPLLALLWLSQYDNEMFLDLRDNLLLTNYYGKKFSDFYYTYTLYPAETFKSLDQKIIKTTELENIADDSNYPNIVSKLIANDYFPLSNLAQVDLKINQQKGFLVFKADDHPVFQIRTHRFLSNPREALQSYSSATDRHTVFRQLTFLSLLIGFPILIYVFLHAVLYFPIVMLINHKAAALTASIMCLLIGMIVLIHFHSNRGSNIDINEIAEALRSSHIPTRIAALKTVQQKKLEISAYPTYSLLYQSQIPQERYWFVRALAVSRRPDSIRDLLTFINDKNTNVRCMAFRSLGLRNNTDAVGPILESIRVSQDWYSQIYAYKALRALGWNQTKLP
jgi:hypothetical protein